LIRLIQVCIYKAMFGSTTFEGTPAVEGSAEPR
jgi:hypothetical protein